MRARSLVVGAVTGAACVLGSLTGAGMAGAAGTQDAPGGVTPNIVGGDDADQQYPFMVSLQDRSAGHFCGGSLIKSDWVVTAAHCVQSKSPEDTQARVGSNDRTQGGEQAQASEIIVHPDYSGTGAGGDIALIKLAEPVQAATIPLASDAQPGTASRLIGWGQTCPEPGGGCDLPVQLQQLDTQVINADQCSGIDGDVELCTDNPGGDSGACYGDSGGPQMMRADGRWQLIGVTSRSGNEDSACATGPSIYTSAVSYAEWIGQNTSGSMAA